MIESQDMNSDIDPHCAQPSESSRLQKANLRHSVKYLPTGAAALILECLALCSWLDLPFRARTLLTPNCGSSSPRNTSVSVIRRHLAPPYTLNSEFHTSLEPTSFSAHRMPRTSYQIFLSSRLFRLSISSSQIAFEISTAQ